jgi:hypothetical protein
MSGIKRPLPEPAGLQACIIDFADETLVTGGIVPAGFIQSGKHLKSQT